MSNLLKQLDNQRFIFLAAQGEILSDKLRGTLIRASPEFWRKTLEEVADTLDAARVALLSPTRPNNCGHNFGEIEPLLEAVVDLIDELEILSYKDERTGPVSLADFKIAACELLLSVRNFQDEIRARKKNFRWLKRKSHKIKNVWAEHF